MVAQIIDLLGAAVVAQLVEQSLPTPEVRGSTPVIHHQNFMKHLFSVNLIEKTKIKKKKPGMAHF